MQSWYIMKKIKTFFSRVSKIINASFEIIIIAQFIISGITISLSIFKLTRDVTDPLEIVVPLFYLPYILLQFLLYCHFGNETMHKVNFLGKKIFRFIDFYKILIIFIQSIELSNEIYNIQWYALNNSSKKTLSIIMMRSSKPIVINGGFLTTLTYSSYLKVSIIFLFLM